jgi:hypothetical protein
MHNNCLHAVLASQTNPPHAAGYMLNNKYCTVLPSYLELGVQASEAALTGIVGEVDVLVCAWRHDVELGIVHVYALQQCEARGTP